MFLLRLTSSDQTASFSFTSLTSNVRVAPPIISILRINQRRQLTKVLILVIEEFFCWLTWDRVSSPRITIGKMRRHHHSPTFSKTPGWFQTIVNSTQDSFLQLCQFSLIIIKLWNLMKKSIFWVRKKALLVILLLRPIYGGTLCILNESWCNVKIRFTCCMTAILIFRYHIRPPYIHSLHLSWTNMNRKKMEGKLN